MAKVLPLVLLLFSNLFMTAAWYGHLREHRSSPLVWVVLLSWLIALFEYALQVPANRIGFAAGYSLAELKTIQEVLSLTVFIVFARFYFGESLHWNHLVGFALIAAGAAFVFRPW